MESDGNNMKKQPLIKKSDGKYNLLFYLLQSIKPWKTHLMYICT